LTLQHGVCKESCVALASCSYFLCEFQDFKGAEYIGGLSIGILEKLKALEYLSQVYICTFGGIFGWIRNSRLNLESILLGYQVGMQTGDIQHAMFNASSYIKNSFFSGLNLREVERNIDKFGKEMIEYNQKAVYKSMLPVKRAVSDLILSTQDPLVMAQNSAEQNALFQQVVEDNNPVVVCDIYVFSGIIAYIYSRYELAAALVQKRHELEKNMSRTQLKCGVTAFYDGLIFLAMAHNSSEFEWSSKISNVMSNVEKFEQIGKSNNEHKLLLLEAEIKSRIGEKDDALKKYQLAIAAAEKNGFTHEQAIANERAADFFLRNNDKDKASQYYGEAYSLYLKWGAQGKADDLCKNIPF